MTSGPIHRFTALVIARDRYSTILRSVAALFDQSEYIDAVLIADAGYPPSLLARTRDLAMAAGVDCNIVNVGLFSTTNHAWNELIRRVETGWIIALENDVRLGEGCLDSLAIGALDESAVMTPVILEADGRSVHFRPRIAELRSLPGGGVRVLLDRGRESLKDLEGSCREIDVLERHCFAMSIGMARGLGDLDELMTCRTDLDLSLAIRASGGRIVQRYDACAVLDGSPLDVIDRGFYDFRWDVHRVEAANRRLISKWQLVGYKNTVDHVVAARRHLSEG